MCNTEDRASFLARLVREENLEMVNARSFPVVPKKSFYLKYVKRVIDLGISVPAFVILLPVNAVLGVCTLADVGRPLFFVQERTGLNGKHFNIIKFRNMTNA